MQINKLQIFQQISAQAAASAASQQNPRQQQAQSLTERPVEKSRRKEKGRLHTDQSGSQDAQPEQENQDSRSASKAPGHLLDVHA